MSRRGYTVLRDADGEAIYTTLTINDTTQYRFNLKTRTAGVEAAQDVSSASAVIHLRISRPGVAAIPIDVTLTKTNGGADGIVDGEARALAADFPTNGEYVDAEVVLEDTSTADANTPSTNKETRLLGGRWEMKVQAEIDNV